jgi:hypothetical protein
MRSPDAHPARRAGCPTPCGAWQARIFTGFRSARDRLRCVNRSRRIVPGRPDGARAEALERLLTGYERYRR